MQKLWTSNRQVKFNFHYLSKSIISVHSTVADHILTNATFVFIRMWAVRFPFKCLYSKLFAQIVNHIALARLSYFVLCECFTNLDAYLLISKSFKGFLPSQNLSGYRGGSDRCENRFSRKFPIVDRGRPVPLRWQFYFLPRPGSFLMASPKTTGGQL